jgi:pyrroloquinoline quinone (PQQ) biosynthesis protein C
MPTLIERITIGCKTSPFSGGIQDATVIPLGSEICLSLWPFIRELPRNIALVRDSLPENMDAGKKLFNQLADEELTYQQMYVKQCHLAGITDEQLKTDILNEASLHLCQVIRRWCESPNYKDGVLAVVTAELAATAYARQTLEIFEKYFLQDHADQYSKEEVEDGLEWLRHHSRPHTRHALWMRRMLDDIEVAPGDKLPPAAQTVLDALYHLWKCPQETDEQLLEGAR